MSDKNNDLIKVICLLIHAARIDDNYTDVEKKIIKETLVNLVKISESQATEILIEAEKKES